MIRTLRTGVRLTILALLLSLAPLVPADSRAAQLYDIELVVFENLVKNDGGEVWPRVYPGWFDADEGGTAAVAERDVAWLSKSQYRLNAHYEALRRSAQYRPLAHLAWRQAVLDRDRAGAVSLPARGAKPGGAYVDGTVRVAVERYLHLYLDLQLHSAMPAGFQQTGELDSEAVPEFRLREHRRMRSKELHYFDNPRFGVLALITPHQPAPAETPAPGEAGGEPATE